MITFSITRGNEKGQYFSVPPEGITIGRDLQNAICLTDVEISRNHCRIVIENGVPFLEDLNSSNGTTVNGLMVRRVQLEIGDHIQLGQTDIAVVAPDFASPTEIKPPKRPHPLRLASTLSPGPVHTETPEEKERFVAVMKSNLQFMYRASMATSRKEVGPMLDDVLALIFEWTEADRGCILLREGPKKRLRPHAVRHREDSQNKGKIEVSRSILQHVDKTAEGIVYSSEANAPAVASSESFIESGISEVICVPIRGRNYPLGLIYIDRQKASPLQETCFGEDHLKLLLAIAHQTAVAIENNEYYAMLLEKERMLAVGETAEKLSHRIKNILQSINGGSFLVDEGLSNADISTAEKGWTIVKRNQERISRLVLELMMINTDFTPTKESFCITEMVRSGVEKQRFEATQHNVEITYDCAIPSTTLLGDRQALLDAVEYVIGEAIKNSRGVDQAQVTVSLQATSEVIEIFVKSAEAIVDDDENETDYKSEIFSAAKEFFPGLELSASQKILRGHGGNVEIANNRTHERYRIWIPLTLDAEASSDASN